jgi:hypothetical protein
MMMMFISWGASTYHLGDNARRFYPNKLIVMLFLPKFVFV